MSANYVVAPGEFLKEWIEEEGSGITQQELSEQLGVSRKLVNEILKGKAPISPETAIKLGRVTSIPSSAWTLYEAQYRDDLAKLDERKALEQHVDIVTSPLASYLRNLGVSTATLRDRVAVLSDLLDFTGYGNFDAYELACRAKLGRSLATLRESNASYDEALMMAWLTAGERTKAYSKVPFLKFDRNKLLDLLPQIKQRVMSSDATMIQDITLMLESAGVVYQFVEAPSKFPIYGITTWTRSGVPVIQQTGRRKKNSNTIWTLFHELGHILYDATPATQIEMTKPSSDKNAEEKVANQFARDWLFGDNMRAYRGMTRSREIEARALQLGHVPCSVIQELHRRRILNHSWCNDLICDVVIPYQVVTV